MKINFLNLTKCESVKGSILVIAVSLEETKKNKSNCTIIKKAKKLYGFKGNAEEVYMIADDQSGLSVIFGLGAEKAFDNLAAQKLGGKISGYLNNHKIKNATIIFGGFKNNSELAAYIAFGIKLHNYRFNKYFHDKKKDKDAIFNTVSLFVDNSKSTKDKFNALEIVANNVFFTRDLICEPSNTLNPESYAAICANLKKEGLEVEILGEKEMKKLNMGALLAVGQGSNKESQLVIMKWLGAKNKKDQPLAFVGKGVTFDTGGISIKPSARMGDMKFDMGGSAVVVGLLRLLAQRKAKINVVGVIGLVENMPSGSAYKPGDVVTSMSGQTIEVDNTDAEGRLVLADALHYTNTKFKPKFIVDLATLTGAIIVALANVHAGLFSNDDKLSQQIEKAGKKTGETVWRLPVSQEYDDMINSDIADIKNVGNGKGAGSTTAAQFLKRFIGKTSWAHLDIAGVALEGKHNPLAVKGVATGYGVKLLNQLIIDNYEK